MWHVEDVRDVILIFFEWNAIYVKDVEDRSNTPEGCNALYVEDVKDGKRTHTHIFAHNFLNIQPIFNPKKVLESWDLGLMYVEDVKGWNDLQHLWHASTYIRFDGMVGKP